MGTVDDGGRAATGGGEGGRPERTSRGDAKEAEQTAANKARKTFEDHSSEEEA